MMESLKINFHEIDKFSKINIHVYLRVNLVPRSYALKLKFTLKQYVYSSFISHEYVTPFETLKHIRTNM